MRRTVAVALLVAGLLLAPLTAAAAPGLADATAGVVGVDASQDGANDSISPGERVSGAIGAEGAELEGEVGERSFGAALAAAETNDSAAAVVDERLDRIQTRLDRLEARNASITDSYENGSLTHGAYAARAAAIEAERASLQRQLNATRTAVDRLPEDALAANGVDAARIDELRTRASELTGQEVRDLARSIAGPNVGNGVGPDDRGPGEIPGLGEGGLPGDRGPGDGPGHGDGPGDDGNASDGGDGNTSDGDGGGAETGGDAGGSGDSSDSSDTDDSADDADASDDDPDA
jgi:hypothetical protein